MSNVASSLSQRPSRSATKQTAPSRTTSDTTAARTLPYHIFRIKSRSMTTQCSRMSRHHCHSARRESRPSNCALSNNEGHRGCQKRSHTNIYSLAHVMGMLPQTYHHCHSTRRGTRPSNYALSNDERPAAALTSPMTLIHPSIYMNGKQSNAASSLSQRPSRIATEQLRALK